MVEVKIFIASKYPVIRRGLRELLKSKSEYICIGESEYNKAALIAREAKMALAQILILDLAFDQRPLEVDLIKQLKKSNPLLKVIVLTTDRQDIYSLLSDHAAGYLSAEEIEEELIRAIQLVAQNHHYYSPQITDKVAHLFAQGGYLDPLSLLTEREEEVLKMRNKNMSTRQIACHFSISVSTVRTHMRNINRKLRPFGLELDS